MLETLRNFLLYGGVSKEEYDAVRPRIEAYNRATALVFALVAFALIAAVFGLSFVLEGLADARGVYLLGMALALVLVGVALASRRFAALTYVAVYLAVSAFLLYGIAIGTLVRPEQQTVTFMVMLIFVPLIFVGRPARMNLVLAVFVVLFVALSLQTKSGNVLAVDVTDAVVFGLLSMASTSVVYRAKVRGYALDRQLQVQGETDQLTGLRNRNCYEQRLAGYAGEDHRSLGCAYIDANGLHELNNASGHKAGDAMLQAVARAVRDQFGDRDSYRVGGDEFVAFAPDAAEAELRRRACAVKDAVHAHGYRAAVGIAHAQCPDAAGVDRLAAAEIVPCFSISISCLSCSSSMNRPARL